MSGLESILFAPRSSWTGPGDSWIYVSVRYIRQQPALFLVTRPVTLNLANSIKCVGDSHSYLSYARSLLCTPDFKNKVFPNVSSQSTQVQLFSSNSLMNSLKTCPSWYSNSFLRQLVLLGKKGLTLH